MKKKKLSYHGRFVTVSAESYQNNGTLAIMLTYEDNGETEVLSVNLNSPLQDRTRCFLDTNHNADVENWIRANNLGHPLNNITLRSGFWIYPLYVINTDAL